MRHIRICQIRTIRITVLTVFKAKKIFHGRGDERHSSNTFSRPHPHTIYSMHVCFDTPQYTEFLRLHARRHIRGLRQSRSLLLLESLGDRGLGI